MRNMAADNTLFDQRPRLSTHQKALKINLDTLRYGTFAEIGAGQEVARWFFKAGGAAGTIGLAQFVNSSKGDANALLMTGAVMLGGIITGRPPVSLTQATPIARLTTEYNVFVLPADSPFKSMKEVVAQLQKDPGSIKWGGGSRSSTEHIAASMLARQVGVDPKKVNYVAFRGGGEATALAVEML